MKGAPIAGAMVAARAFLPERRRDMPVSVIAFSPDDTVAHRLHDDGAGADRGRRDSARDVRGHRTSTTRSSRPPSSPKSRGSAGDHRAALRRNRRGSEASRAEALEALKRRTRACISVGLRSPQYDPESLQSVARRSGGTLCGSANPKPSSRASSPRSAPTLASEYEVTYRSLLPPNVKANVTATYADSTGPKSRRTRLPPLALSTDAARSSTPGSTR